MKNEVTHPSGCKIKFDEANHIYTIDNTRLNSVTKICKRYKHRFEFEKILDSYCRKHNLNKKHVRSEWNSKRELAVDLGNACHAYAESLIDNVTISNRNKYKDYYIQIKKKIKQDLKNYDKLMAECIVAYIDKKIAGTIDILKLKDKTIVIGDWKTNETIKMSNSWNTMLPPFQYLDDCDFNTYRLQLNIYRYILEKENYYPGYSYEMVLHHVKKDRIVDILIEKIDNDIFDKYL